MASRPRLRGVELAAIHAGRDDDVGLVDGQSLRSADSGRVGKSDVVGDVVGGEGDPSAVAEVCELEGPAALVDVDHVPAIVVVDPLAGTVGKAAVVASGFDVITDADGLVLDIGVDADPVRLYFTSHNACGPCLRGKLVRGGVVVGEHDCVVSCVVSGPPAGETVTLCLRVRATMDAAMAGERFEARRVTTAELGKGVGFPAVSEPVCFVELGCTEGFASATNMPPGARTAPSCW